MWAEAHGRNTHGLEDFLRSLTSEAGSLVSVGGKTSRDTEATLDMVSGSIISGTVCVLGADTGVAALCELTDAARTKGCDAP